MVEELNELTNECLPYLIDKGVRVNIANSITYIDRNYIYLSEFNGLKWCDIKYDIIPLISLLNHKFKIRQNVLFRIADGLDHVRNTRDRFIIEDITDDKISDDIYIVDIQIYITRM